MYPESPPTALALAKLTAAEVISCQTGLEVTQPPTSSIILRYIRETTSPLRISHSPIYRCL